MVRYQIHTIDSAPERSKPLLQMLQTSVGMIPNLAATMAESTELLKGFCPSFFHNAGRSLSS